MRRATPALLTLLLGAHAQAAQVPVDLTFADEKGAEVRLGDVLGDRPALLTLVYFNCPLLCNAMLNNLVQGLQGLPWAPGEGYRIVTVSIDPREGPELATQKKKNYLDALGKDVPEGWRFLTGKHEDIKALAASVSWAYTYEPESMQYIHGAEIMFLAPGGRLASYLRGPTYPTKQLRLALLDAGEGSLGGLGDSLAAFPYSYDEARRAWAVSVSKMSGVGAGAGALVLLLLLVVARRRHPPAARAAGSMNSVTGGC